MSDDIDDTGENESEDSIVLISEGESYWLLKGEKYLDAMLSAKEYYPTPVKAIKYESLFELQMDLEEGVFVGSLWVIHPGIIGRLEREELIVEQRR